MSLESLIGQPFAVELCRTWLKRQTTHPLLYFGPDGVGKRTLALEVAKALNCETKTLDACGDCISCKKIASGNHPDVRVIDLAWQALARKEPIEKQQSLRIETILSERHRLLQSAVEGRWKVSLIEDAHRLTPDAANVLLKILEEPPHATAIFLITPYRDRLFPTILSRCQPVRFRALANDEMLLCLSQLQVPKEMHPQLTEMALGSPGRALHLNRADQIEAVREAEALWQKLGTLSPTRMLNSRPKTFKPTRPEIEQQIQSLLVPATRALRSGDLRAGKPVRHIENALTQLRQNVQPALVYDNLVLQLSKDKR